MYAQPLYSVNTSVGVGEIFGYFLHTHNIFTKKFHYTVCPDIKLYTYVHMYVQELRKKCMCSVTTAIHKHVIHIHNILCYIRDVPRFRRVVVT